MNSNLIKQFSMNSKHDDMAALMNTSRWLHIHAQGLHLVGWIYQFSSGIWKRIKRMHNHTPDCKYQHIVVRTYLYYPLPLPLPCRSAACETLVSEFVLCTLEFNIQFCKAVFRQFSETSNISYHSAIDVLDEHSRTNVHFCSKVT